MSNHESVSSERIQNTEVEAHQAVSSESESQKMADDSIVPDFPGTAGSGLKNLTVNNSGYPGDKPFGTQWFNAGSITQVTDRKIYYMVDTYGGQSGSPVWRFLNGQRHGVGIHAYGGCPNSATRIVKAVFDNMLAWRNLGF